MDDRRGESLDDKVLRQMLEGLVEKIFSDVNQGSTEAKTNEKRRTVDVDSVSEANRRIEEASKKAKSAGDGSIILPGRDR